MLTRSARWSLAAIGLALILPVAAMRLQSTDSLEQFHNRVLTRWPSGNQFWADPARYFARANAWLAERIYPVVAVVYARHNVEYALLGMAPSPNITVAPDHLVFLNGTDAEHVDNLVVNACVLPAVPENAARLQAAMDDIGRFALSRGYPIDVVLVPTVPTLMGDRLPRSIPAAERKACALAAAGRSRLSHIASSPGVHFVYPLEAMSAHRDDRAFFPNGHFHPDGWSVQVVRDAYLAETGSGVTVEGERTEPTMGPAEVLQNQGVDVDLPIYTVSSVAAVDAELTELAKSAFVATTGDVNSPVYGYANPQAPDSRTILMLSDSYGYNEGFSFAGVFKRVLQMSSPQGKVVRLLDELARVVHYDRVVILFNDGNFGLVSEIGEALRAATPSPPSR